MAGRKLVFRFGSGGRFELDVEQLEVRANGERLALEQKPFEVLLFLIRNADRVVSKDELLESVWAGTAVSEASLTTALRQIRAALGDSARTPDLIETFRGRGYRFIGNVEMAERSDVENRTRPVRSRTPYLVAAPLLLVAIVAVGWQWLPRVPEGPPIRSIAVLPLLNLSGNESEEYFATGVTEDLIGALSEIRSIRVPAHRSVLRYRNSEQPLPEIAQELDVDALIEGTVRREDDRVRITVQLVRGPEDEHLWHQTYDEDLTQILRLQARIADAVAARVRETVEDPEAFEVERPLPKSVVPAAYDAYLKGRHMDNLKANTRLTLQQFRRAVQLDPDFGDGHAWLGQMYFEMALFGIESANTMMPRAREHGHRAVELGANEGYVVLGWVALYQDRDWDAAEELIATAVELTPYAIWQRAVLDCIFGRWEACAEGIEEAEKDLFFDFGGHAISLELFARMRRFEDAIAGAESLNSIEPGFPMSYGAAVFANLFQGNYDAAYQWWYELATRFPFDEELAVAAHERGDWGAWWEASIEMFAEVLPANRSILMAGKHAYRGEAEDAFMWLERSYQERIPGMILVFNMDPHYDPIRDDPRFAELASRFGIPLVEPPGPLVEAPPWD